MTAFRWHKLLLFIIYILRHTPERALSQTLARSFYDTSQLIVNKNVLRAHFPLRNIYLSISYLPQALKWNGRSDAAHRYRHTGGTSCKHIRSRSWTLWLAVQYCGRLKATLGGESFAFDWRICFAQVIPPTRTPQESFKVDSHKAQSASKSSKADLHKAQSASESFKVNLHKALRSWGSDLRKSHLRAWRHTFALSLVW